MNRLPLDYGRGADAMPSIGTLTREGDAKATLFCGGQPTNITAQNVPLSPRDGDGASGCGVSPSANRFSVHWSFRVGVADDFKLK